MNLPRDMKDVEVVPGADESEEEGEEDTFQCGKCKRKFTMLAAYFAHKKEPCTGKPPTSLWHRPTHCTSATMGAVDRMAAASQTLTALRQSLPRNARVILSEADLLTLSSSLEGASQIALEEQTGNSGEDPMGQDVLLSSDLSEDATCSAVVTVSQRLLVAMERCKEEISVLDAMYIIASSWSTVSESTMTNSFEHCGFMRETAFTAGNFTPSMQEDASSIDDDEFESLNPASTFAEFVEANDDVATCDTVAGQRNRGSIARCRRHCNIG
ncbi:hypothetical protein HPB50_017234 [Hyalomma asiaticum]|uniref:Uncharacterized protein n=1 Tax=Hyalomma asiaticum TaxID=266040 RepID=A0ACB7TJ01_HYAAI|nr:hypothetical protein HPB50_017234 [Hyalomma asiaticum]